MANRGSSATPKQRIVKLHITEVALPSPQDRRTARERPSGGIGRGSLLTPSESLRIKDPQAFPVRVTALPDPRILTILNHWRYPLQRAMVGSGPLSITCDTLAEAWERSICSVLDADVPMVDTQRGISAKELYGVRITSTNPSRDHALPDRF